MAALFDSPLRRRQRFSARFERKALRAVRHFHSTRLFGRRAMAAPGMALAARKDLGVNRHVLNQMVVAGTVKFMPAFPPPARPTEPLTEPPAAPPTSVPDVSQAAAGPAGPPRLPASANGEFPPGTLPSRAGTASVPLNPAPAATEE